MRKESLHIIDHVKDIIEEYDIALTLRQIYYRLVAKQIIPNRQDYYRKLSRICVNARDEGLLPENAFADRLREIEQPSTWVNLKDYFESVREFYRKSLWLDQPNYIEIWIEKDALRTVFSEITHEFDVPLLVVRGQVSRTAIYQAAQRFKQKFQEDKKCHLYYFGDFDPSGLAIYKSLCNRLSDMGCGYSDYHDFDDNDILTCSTSLLNLFGGRRPRV